MSDQSQRSASEGPRPLVLFVDDDEMLRASSCRSLSRRYDVLQAGTPEDACDLIDQHTVDGICRISVAIVDLWMPKRGSVVIDENAGLSLIRRIKPDESSHSEPPYLLVLTGHESEENCRQCLVAGACWYVVKSDVGWSDELRKRIELLLAIHREHPERADPTRRSRIVEFVRKFVWPSS